MVREVIVKKNTYRDSVNLMLLADQIGKMPGIDNIAILMGTPANKDRLSATGFQPSALETASPGDLCIGVEAKGAAEMEAALKAIDEFISGKSQAHGTVRFHTKVSPRTLSSALKVLPSAQLAVISLPGEYAGAEARKALEMGLHVFLFSDNVPLEEEKFLKTLARERGLLLMGPDCGTALINGCPLGFCNQVPRGPIGLVTASGTGAQEIMSRIAENGLGVSHILGTGGRDLSREVGGITFEMALQTLGQDETTSVIILVSKPPSPEVEAKIFDLARTVPKPVIVSFVGRQGWKINSANIIVADNLEHAAQIAIAIVMDKTVPPALSLEQFLITHRGLLSGFRKRLSPNQRFVRGLYSGGTLANEAALILSGFLPEVRAGEGFASVLPIDDWDRSVGNVVIDLGDGRFTRGRPHPMIDSRTRVERIRQESEDPSVAVLLMDVILGFNADENPAAHLVPAIIDAREQAVVAGRSLAVIVHICGTANDIQDLDSQIQQFEGAGCLVFRSNVQAALAAAWIATERES